MPGVLLTLVHKGFAMIRSLLQNVISSMQTGRRIHKLAQARRRQMHLEQLDDRRMLTGGISLSEAGQLNIAGENSADSVRIWKEEDRIKATLTMGDARPITREYPASTVKQIAFHAYE